MKYFSISSSNDEKVIGHYPQTDFRIGYNPNLPNSHWQVKPYEFPDFLPNYELELHKNANITNFIQGCGGYHGIIIDFKFKEILEEFNLPPHRFYPIKVFHKGKPLEYYWFHFIVPNLWQVIDLSQSRINISHCTNFENHVSIPVIEEKYVEKLTELSLNKFTNNFEYDITPENIILKDSFEGYDIIEIKHLYNSPLISHKLKKTLEDSFMTGFDTKLFKPLKITK